MFLFFRGNFRLRKKILNDKIIHSNHYIFVFLRWREIMFEKGDYVVNSNNGICEINDIVTMNMGNGDKKCYVLIPIEERKAKIFIPIDTAEKRIRLAMNKDEAWRIIKEISAVDEAFVENEREREKFYKETINSREPKRLISLMKMLYIRKQKRLEEGKKITSVDGRYFKLAENQLYGELAFALGVEKSEINQIIEQNIE